MLLKATSLSIAYGMAAATYAGIGFVLAISLNYGFHLHIRWPGLSAALFSGMMISKFILKDVSYSHGKAMYEGQLRAQQQMMQKAMAIQAEKAAQEAAPNPFEEEAIRRALQKFGDDGDTPTGAYL